MKQTLILIAVLLFTTTLFAKKPRPKIRTDFDTIQVFEAKVQVKFRTYYDSTLRVEAEAFLYPSSIKIRRSRWLPRFIQIKLAADSVVLHGTATTIEKDGKYRIGKYEHGEKIEVHYYNADGNEITRRMYYGNVRSHRDPDSGNQSYFIRGRKKPKKKRGIENN
ncbi:MAG: hypothetical protein AB8F95_17015 [Bacteroidia bacterium]